MTEESKKVKFLRVLLLILSIALIAAIALACAYLVWEKAPGGDSKDVFTIFISGIDEQNYSTDINMLIKIDTEKQSIDVVVVPPDTLLNIDFQIRKLPNVYLGAVKNGKDAWKSIDEQLVRIIGFEVDAYAFIPKSVFLEFITDGRIEDMTTFFSILNSSTDTNLTASNIAFLTRQSVDLDEEAVSYYWLPTYSKVIRGYNYEVINLPEWIEMLNRHLNSTGDMISADSLDIVYMDGEAFAGTKELLGTWYYDNINEELYEGGNSDEEAIPAY